MRDWPLLSLRKPALLYWCLIYAAAVGVFLTSSLGGPPPTEDEIRDFGVLAGVSVLVVVLTSACDPFRAESPQNLWAVHVAYLLAGALTLPTNLVVLLMIGPVLQGVLEQRPGPHRWLFTTAATTVATFVACLVAGTCPNHYENNLFGSLMVGGTLLSARALLVGIGFWLRKPEARPNEVFGEPLDVGVGIVAVCTGVLSAMVLLADPLAVILLVPPFVLLGRATQLAQWRRSAQRDPKTGLTNATHWNRLARAELVRTRVRRTTAAVLLLDLDHFKRVNDEVGHLAGDSALAAVAELLQNEVQRRDLVGRFGGEEFVILLPNTDPVAAERQAERIRLAVSGLAVPTTAADGRPRLLTGLTISIGVATSSRFGYEIDALMVAADSALLSAKNAGRNLVTLA
ncbi:GGDEF domain-containing protein [Allokutzneria sp. A3M-2-11 16]|uniref:GGDEF domain-containing protein n=1 Tax=Allokutzneria sp. A3M-2-11 16 TaxID=2962043 RepID=UPI0020B8F802|nr:GGDEF domain-containing protein [Allokutzneria sp. A3M-2-11 16]MCP3799459.1 GGDEF domain-containing protein [Allokutzneria sp. A3M-2-11 16]